MVKNPGGGAVPGSLGFLRVGPVGGLDWWDCSTLLGWWEATGHHTWRPHAPAGMFGTTGPAMWGF